MSNTVAGIDGARGGWVVAELTDADTSIRFQPEFAPTVDALCSSALAAAVVDMPIGLSADGQRPADREARDLLGPRRATFFPTPVRAVLMYDQWEDANQASREASGKGLSKQAWNLVPKIREIDDLWSCDLSDLLSEGHPEVSFAAMAGSPLTSKKSTTDGRAARIELLIEHVDRNARELVDGCPTSWQGDAVDALALAWTARRLVTGEAHVLGGELDERGRPMRLVI